MIDYDKAKAVAKEFFEGEQSIIIPSGWSLDCNSFGSDSNCLIVKTEECAYFFKADDFE